MNLRGRPTAYRPDVHPVVAAFYAQEGLTEEEMANRFGVTTRTLSYWKKAYPEFLLAVKTSKDEADSKVVESLYKLALKGNVTAQIFWLKNRQPAQWRDVWKIDGRMEYGGSITIEKKQTLSIEEVVKRYADAGSSGVPEQDGSVESIHST